VAVDVTDLRIDDPCILFALGREGAGFRREFAPTQRFPGAPCRARFCGPSWLSVLVVETGVGPRAVEQALDWLFSKPKLELVPYAPKIILLAGFAGSLVDSLHVGDLVLATDVVDLDGNRWPTTWPGELPAGPWQPSLRRGTVLSAPKLVCDPHEKRRLGQSRQALTVDMESVAFASLCSKCDVPFGCLRAVSDDLDTPLSPVLESLLAGGRVVWWRVLLALLRRPVFLKELLRLRRDTASASARLGEALGELLTLTLEEHE
jgi:nucleoside phosphorylase